MMRVRRGTVTAVMRPRPGLARLRVLVDGAESRAYALPPWDGRIEQGDEVLLNTTSGDLGLGSSEGHVVLADLSRPEVLDSRVENEMKLRYAPSQIASGATRSETPSGDVDLGGMPVIVTELHSALAPILAALRLTGAGGKPVSQVAYLMPDWNSLPIVLSETVARARELDWIGLTITCGHAFGGEIEAAGLAAGLALALERGCSVALVIGGPGHLGARQPFGFSGACQAEAMHLAWALGGRPVFAPRLSEADPRERHQGVSHHTRTILGRLLLTDVELPIPASLDPRHAAELRELAERTGSTLREVELPDYAPMCEAAGLCLGSMGRGWEQDRVYFDTVAATGTYVGSLLAATGQRGLQDAGGA